MTLERVAVAITVIALVAVICLASAFDLTQHLTP